MPIQCRCSDNCACRNCRYAQELRTTALHFKNEGALEHAAALLEIYRNIDNELRTSARGPLRLQGAQPQTQIHRR